ncbi:hypothetical protein P280DRAFT_228488 [Massarina eburnea CBS 473.64]|uniref:NACHT domain-containing protein n=1 Tax=Massarina eburnea CBS 473.64 TaxID=1395130 RepID=A0A6A6S8S8_9PLEO|nr:hypothetical protein P280DRAFT_228488 [Massarina eburnea CBS 473.64]
MSPLQPTVGLASAIVQSLDFADKILSHEHSVHHSSKGASPGDHAVLQNVANNLYRLTSKIAKADKKAGKIGGALLNLLSVGEQTRTWIGYLAEYVLQAQAKLKYEEPEHASVRDALATVKKDKELVGLKEHFGDLRGEVDATLLVALRQPLDQSQTKDLSGFAVEDFRVPFLERWQERVIEAIQTNGWQANKKQHLQEFSKVLDTLVVAENEAHFRNEIFGNLHFTEQDDRLHSITPPQEGTCDWIFEPRLQKGTKLLEWLGETTGQNLFWLTGKPGCGKTTLMKYMFRNEMLFPKLEEWSGLAPGILTGFFLWNCGTNIQKTTVGLLRALLYETLQDMIYGPLEQDPGIIQYLFEDRWNQFKSYGAGFHPFPLSELRKAFELLVSDASKKFLIMVDGLDELEDSPSHALDMILGLSYRSNVKIIVSSRPTEVFEQAFQDRSRLELNKWTRTGILSYVLHAFDQNDVMFGIPDQESDGTEERAIINSLVDKASGEYLWATLGTEILIQTTKETDSVKTIRARVDALPPDLSELLAYIIDSMDTKSLTQASRVFRLIDAHGYPLLLPLCFANDPDTKSSLSAETAPLTMSEVLSRVTAMRLMLKTRCKTLLTIFEAKAPEGSLVSDATTSDLMHFRVTYTHRVIKEFIQEESMRSRVYTATGNDALNTDEHWANAHLWSLKTPAPSKDGKIAIWDMLADCIEHALRLEASTKRVRLTYLDEVSATLDHYIFSSPITSLDLPSASPTVTVSSFLDIAVWLNLSGYIKVKARTTDRKLVKHAWEFSKEMRKMNGIGGEEKWVRGRGRLREAYARVDGEVVALLKEHRKTMRIGSPKVAVDMPEWV